MKRLITSDVWHSRPRLCGDRYTHSRGRLCHKWCVLALLALACLAGVASAEPPVNLRRTPIVEVFQANRDAVVNVNTTKIVRQRFGLFGDDPFFRLFDMQPYERNVKRQSLGSGFIVHEQGYVVTNAHVVEGADAIEIILASGKHLDATVLATDTQHDVAILQVDVPDGLDLPAVTLGDSSDLMIGEPVIAIGNPLGYEHSVTAGIISATDRDLPVSRQWKLERLIQTDASINPGNSGGPLLNAYGQVIGITTAIRGDAQNIGFAIPVNHLRELVPDLLSPLAIKQFDLGGQIIEQSRIEPPAKITTTLRWQATDEDEPGHVITAINDRKVDTIIDAYVELLQFKEGDAVTFSNGQTSWQVEVRRAAPTDTQRIVRNMLGVEAREPTAGDRARLQLGKVDGVLITGVERDSPAHRAGLRPGDVIVQLGRHRINGMQGLAVLLSRAGEGVRADVYVVRDGQLGRTRLKLRGASI